VAQQLTLKSKLIPLELYIPDLDITDITTLNYIFDVSRLESQPEVLARLEDLLATIDDKYALHTRRGGGKRITVEMTKMVYQTKEGVVEDRKRVMRFVPYPGSTINHIMSLRTKAWAVLEPYTTSITTIRNINKKDVKTSVRLIHKDMLFDAYEAIDKINKDMVEGVIRSEIRAFEDSSDFASIIDFLATNKIADPAKIKRHMVYPDVRFSLMRPGVFDESLLKFVDEKKQKMVTDIDVKKRELLAKMETDISTQRDRMVSQIENNMRNRLEPLVLNLAELLQRGGTTMATKTTARKVSQLKDLSKTLGLEKIYSTAEMVDSTLQAMLSKDNAQLLSATKRLVASCGLAPTEDSSRNIQVAVAELKGTLFTTIIE
jgi:hypothetical protein